MKTKILFLSAIPTDTDRLRLDREVREIETALERSRSRGQFEIVHKSAVRVDDLRRALLDHTPQIVHFSGHGAGEAGLVFENESGKMKLVKAESLARLFKSFAKNVQCVFLNACFSESQADAISQHIDYVIGMNQEMKDQAAIEFAKGFYDALVAERSIEDSFEIGLTSIDLENIPASSIPVLKIRKDLGSTGPSLTSQSIAEATATKYEATRSSSSAFASTEKHSIAGEESVTAAKIPAVVLEEPEGQVPLNSALYVERPPNELPRRKRTGYQHQKRASCSSRCNWRYSLP